MQTFYQLHFKSLLKAVQANNELNLFSNATNIRMYCCFFSLFQVNVLGFCQLSNVPISDKINLILSWKICIVLQQVIKLNIGFKSPFIGGTSAG